MIAGAMIAIMTVMIAYATIVIMTVMTTGIIFAITVIGRLAGATARRPGGAIVTSHRVRPRKTDATELTIIAAMATTTATTVITGMAKIAGRS